MDDEEASEAIEFFETEEIAFGKEGRAEWHTVSAAQVAAIGNGEAQVVDRSTAAVDEGRTRGGGNDDLLQLCGRGCGELVEHRGLLTSAYFCLASAYGSLPV